MAIKLSTLLTACEARLLAELASTRIIDVAGPLQLQSRPQQRLHKGISVYCSATNDLAHNSGASDQRVRDLLIVELCFRLRPKGARTDSKAALDLEDEAIKALSDHAWAQATTWASPQDLPLITFDNTLRSWPVAEWQVSQITFSVHRNQAAQ